MKEPKRILVFVSMFTKQASVFNDKDYQAFFDGVLEDDDHITVEVALITKAVFVVKDNQVEVVNVTNGRSLRDYDLVIIRGSVVLIADLAASIDMYCAHHSIPCWNNYDKYLTRSKLAQTIRFAYLGAPVPDTVFCYDQDEMRDLAEEHLGFPLIAKDWFGTKGNDNYLIKSAEEFVDVTRDVAQRNIQLIAQQYVENDGDVRVLIINKQYLLIGRSAVDGSHLNNTSQGAEATLLTADDVGEQVLTWSQQIADAFDCTLAGVDVLFDRQHKPYFLEVNTQPQIVTGAYIDEKKDLLREAIVQALDGQQK